MPLVIPPSSSLPPTTPTYIHAYKSIVKRTREDPTRAAGGVVIFAGVDVDGVLSTRTLISLLKQDDVPHTLCTISGYAELEEKRVRYFGQRRGAVGEDDEDGEDDRDAVVDRRSDIHTLILLSLGSLLPLYTYFPLSSSSSTHKPLHVHIIDSHRPYNLSNLFGRGVEDGWVPGIEEYERERDEDAAGSSGKIWVWGDGEEGKLDGVKRSWEALEYEPESSDDERTDESDSGDDDDSDSSSAQSDEEGVRDDEDDQDEGVDVSVRSARKRRRAKSTDGEETRKRRKGKQREQRDADRPQRLPRAVRQAHTTRVQKYYQAGASYGLSVAESCYLLASEMERGDNDLLWYAILGLTHQYITSRIDRDEYETRHSLYLDEVARLNPPRPATTITAARNADPDDHSISPSEELRFVLFRHWNLHDAMLHSGYVAGRMGIWKERGRKKLAGLLAKMGFSIQQCQQSYAHMDMDLKSTLRHKLDAIAPEYGLVELTYPSFTRAFGYRCPSLSAADAVEGLAALLEAATGVRIEVEAENGKGGGEWFGGSKTWSIEGVEREGRDDLPTEDKENANRGGNGGLNGRDKQQTAAAAAATVVEDDLDISIKAQQKQHERNFWAAYDAVHDITLLRKSLSLAKSLHAAVIRQGCAILDKNSIKTLRAFRFVAIREGRDLPLFSQASTLARLAQWLVEATRDKVTRQASSKNKEAAHPVVVACLNEEKGTYMVVGVTGAPEFGDIRKNRFGLAFQSAAEDSGAGTRHDMFDTSIVEIRKDDLTTFIECLHMRSA